MEKLKFVFNTKATKDGKSTFIAITSIITENNKVFLIPEEYEAVSFHKYIYASKTYNIVRNSLKKRHQTRSVWIKVTPELIETYFDEDENMKFEDQYLEEVTHEQLAINNQNQSENHMLKILEKLVENQQIKEKQNIKQLANRFVIDKFDGRNISANQWMDVFEKECARFDIKENEDKIEIFRLFLEKSCTDWYASMMIKFTLQSEWTEWKSNFVETYANKGWSSSKYALAFKYQSGSLLEYSIKKEKLLLEVRKTIDQGTMIDLIAAGLPDYVTDRINKEEILETKDLFNEVGKLEHLVIKKKFMKKKENTEPIKDKLQKCTICENLKKGVRYHSESSCWFKAKDNKEIEKKQIKIINNSELECELQSEEPKN